MKSKFTDASILLAGLATGLAALILTKMGNPANMGFCIACFLRDLAGAIGLHQAAKLQYLRPEIIGIVLGAFALSFIQKECALAFLGCPLRMVIRLGGGDFNAITGLVGFVIGIFIGIIFLQKGFSLNRAYPVAPAEGLVLPGLFSVLFLLFITVPAIFFLSTEGPGAKHAPIFASFAVAFVVGALAQKARLCTVGGIRDFILCRDTRLLSGFVVILLTILIGNLALGSFKPGFPLQPISHSNHLWNLLGMILVGWASVMLGGCPFRQLVLSAEGNGDSMVTVLGMIVGAGLAHNFKLAGNPDSLNDAKEFVLGGLSNYGKVAVVACFFILLIVSVLNLPKKNAGQLAA